MSDEIYVDPNSGAAPQPGGYAGVQGMEKGHAIPGDVQAAAEAELAQELIDNEPETEPFDPEQAARDLSAAQREQAEQEAEDAEEDDEAGENGGTEADEDGVPEEVSEVEAADAKALETQGVDLSGATEGGYDPSSGTVEDVLKYVEEHPDQKDAVRKAEESGKNRSGVLNALG